mmetsp:Transcript_24582/g.66850  ORF Transcript_24582/g.66850 Transcript_24582/m.66850 type:complete len:208 (+) Transcript_24582:2262-2885(+)
MDVRRPSMTRSGRRMRSRTRRCSAVAPRMSPGTSPVSGVALASHTAHAALLASISSGSALKASAASLSHETRAHCASVSSSATWSGMDVGLTARPGATKASYSSAGNSPSDFITFSMSCVATTSLWRSKRPRRAKEKTLYVMDSVSAETRSASSSAFMDAAMVLRVSTLSHTVPRRFGFSRKLGRICLSRDDSPRVNLRRWPVIADS